MAYEFSQSVTVDATKVPGDLVDYPVLVNSGPLAHLRTVANGGDVRNANGYDIVFSLTAVSNPTTLDFEIEKYDATTGELVAWVKLPAVSSVTDTVFYIIFGNTAVNTDQSNAPGVWDSDFLSVYHLKEDGGLMGLLDSTSHGRDLTHISGTVPASSTPLQIDGGGNFADDAIGRFYSNVLPTPQTSFPAFPFTLSGWINPGLLIAGATPMGIYGSSGQNTWRMDINNVGGTTMELTYVRHAILAQGFNLLQWLSNIRVYVAIRLDVLGTTASGFLGNAGVFTSQNLAVLNVLLNNPPTNGGMGARDSSLLEPFIGTLDEIRFSTTDRPSDWIEADYNNQFSPATFYALGPVVPFIVPPVPVIISGKNKGGGGVGILSFNIRLNAYDDCLIADRDNMEAISMYLGCPRTPDCFSMTEREWNDVPPGFKTFNPMGSLPLPSPAAGETIIFQFKVPIGYDGMIMGQYHGYSGPGFVQGSGDLVFRIRVANNTNGPRYLKDCANMTVSIGSAKQIAQVFGGLQLRSGNIVQYIVDAPNTSGSLPLPGVGRILAGLHGYFYPRGFRD